MKALKPLLVPFVGIDQAVREFAERTHDRRRRAELLREVAEAGEATGMRVPVFLSELTIGTALALKGEDSTFVRAAASHQRHLLLAGRKGVFEQVS